MQIELQQRDVELIRFLYAHRVASYSQIWRKFFPGRDKSVFTRRLKRLCRGGFVKSAMMPIKGESAERYLMPSENTFEMVRHHWGFEIDKPLYKSESPSHDMHAVDVALRLEKLSQYKKLLPENLLQSSSTLMKDERLGDLVRAQSDGALYITGKTGKEFLFALEIELSDKSLDRYKSKLSAYYLATGINGVLYICSDQRVIAPLVKADEEVRKERNSILHFALEADALAASDKITFRNARSGSFDLK
jgi:hypothetical protein